MQQQAYRRREMISLAAQDILKKYLRRFAMAIACRQPNVLPRRLDDAITMTAIADDADRVDGRYFAHIAGASASCPSHAHHQARSARRASAHRAALISATRGHRQVTYMVVQV